MTIEQDHQTTDTEIKPTLPQFHEDRVYEGIYEIFESEFVEIGRYIAFTEDNLKVYSNKIHELHLRVCSEIENTLKIIIHRHFVNEAQIKELWNTKKSSFLTKKNKTIEYKALKTGLNTKEGQKVDTALFGFPDFSFYFEIACKYFNLDKKVVRFLAGTTTSTQVDILQPFIRQNEGTVPTWWTSYNGIKHDKLAKFTSCTLGDVLHALAGFYILMNYLTKYWSDNIPTFDPNYFRDHPQGNSFRCDYWAFASKIFQASSYHQSFSFASELPLRLSNSEYEARYQKMGIGFDEIVDTIVGEDPNSVKWGTKEYCIFHTYFDYMQYISLGNNELFWQKERYGKFVN